MNKMLIFSILIFMVSCGTPQIKPETNQFQKETEVKAHKEKIYEKSLQWLSDYYSHSSQIIQQENKNKYKIISDKVFIDQDKKIYCTLDLDIRDNKFKITYKNLMFDNGKEISQITLKKLEPKFNTAIYNLRVMINAG